jgi:hypothetical protein
MESLIGFRREERVGCLGTAPEPKALFCTIQILALLIHQVYPFLGGIQVNNCEKSDGDRMKYLTRN